MRALADSAECRGKAAATGNPARRTCRRERDDEADASSEQGLIRRVADGDQRCPEPVS